MKRLLVGLLLQRCKQNHKHTRQTCMNRFDNPHRRLIWTQLKAVSKEARTVCVNPSGHWSLQTLREGGKAMWPSRAFNLKGCAGQAWRLRWCKPRQCWYFSTERSGGSPEPGHRPPDRQTHTLQLWNAYEIFDYSVLHHVRWSGRTIKRGLKHPRQLSV